MKISNSKKGLAKIISENGGWRDGEFSVMCGDGTILNSSNKPLYDAEHGWCCVGGFGDNRFESAMVAKNWCHTILSRAEYFHLYPASDADGWIEWKGGECPVEVGALIDVKYRDLHVQLGSKVGNQSAVELYATSHWRNSGGAADIIAYRLHNPEKAKSTAVGDDETNLESKGELESMEFCESVTRSIPEPETKQTIEQLAADYRNKLDDADRKQDEADKAKLESDAALSELEEAIAAIGFAITPIGADAKEPELVITDWRDLQIGDVIFVDGYDLHEAGEGEVINMENPGYGCDYAVKVMTSGGAERWIDVNEMWRFVRRPAK